MNELKNCPFCNGNPRTEMMITKMGGGEDQVDFFIRCTDCGTAKRVRLTIHGYVNFFDVDKAMEQAAEKWNQRADAK